MSETVVDSETLQAIKALRAVVDRKHVDEPVGAASFVLNGETTNRGNKLKQGASQVHRDQLRGYSVLPLVSKVVIDGEEREFIQRKRKFNETNDEEESDNGDELYNGIDIKRILAPVSKPEEAVTNSSVAKIFQDNSLKNLAEQAIEIIEYEQQNSNSLTKLMELFLGDDPKFLKIEHMALPDYDHQLADGESVDEIKFKSGKHKNDVVIEALNDNGSTNSIKPETYLNTLQNNENKRITRNIDSNYQEVDPFFALPKFEVDPNNGVNPHVANEIRQIVQITLQRNREYIRSLQKIRMGLIRAERLKDQVYKWCREMNGDYDSEIMPPPASNEKKK